MDIIYNIGKDYEIAKNAKRLLDKQKCDYFINQTNKGNIDILEDANKFSVDLYNELFKEEPIIVMKNTSNNSNSIYPREQILINLNAVKRMLIEIESKELIKKGLGEHNGSN